MAPWLPVWDDHELDNNYAGTLSEKPAEQPTFLRRRADAYRAYYENMSLRRRSVPRGIDLQLYRRVSWGDLTTFHMLDTRSTATTRRAATATGPVPMRSRPAAASRGGSRSAGCWTASATPRPPGTCWGSRSSSVAATPTPIRRGAGVDGRTRAITCVASNECPPNSKKLSLAPTAATSSTSAQISHTTSSIGVRGATISAAESGRACAGAGKACRSTFPLDMCGSPSSCTKTDGIMYAGTFSLSSLRNSPPLCAASSRKTT